MRASPTARAIGIRLTADRRPACRRQVLGQTARQKLRQALASGAGKHLLGLAFGIANAKGDPHALALAETYRNVALELSALGRPTILNERGELIKGWPGGFFEEALNEMF